MLYISDYLLIENNTSICLNVGRRKKTKKTCPWRGLKNELKKHVIRIQHWI